MSGDDIFRCHCNGCGRGTDHSLLQKVVAPDADEETDDGCPPFWWTDTYEMLQCRGCGCVCLKHHTAYADGTESTAYYPPPVSRRAPLWQYKLPEDMRGLLQEIYYALHNGSRRLALMGARTLVDMLMLAEVGDVGTFDAKLKALQGKGAVSARSREVLSVALDAGSAAVHRGYRPSREELDAVMDIVENLLEATYHLSSVAQELRKNIPKRP